MLSLAPNQYHRIKDKDYHELSYISYHGLKEISQSINKYIQRKNKKQTAAQEFGSLAHKYLLEPDTIDNDVFIASKENFLTKSGEIAKNIKSTKMFEVMQFENPEKKILLDDEHKEFTSMRDKALAHPEFSKIYFDESCKKEHCGLVQPFLFKQISSDMMLAKFKPDITTRQVIVDYKTTSNASEFAFKTELENNMYFAQAAFYVMCDAEISGMQKDFYIFAQEVEPPYDVNMIKINHDYLNLGFEILQKSAQKYFDYKNGKLKNEIDLGYGADVKDIEPSPWLFSKIMNKGLL